MGHFTVHWGNRLENLADAMFSMLYDTPPEDPLTPCCIVINSNIMQAWLQHFFVFDWQKRDTRILANCSFPLLYPFINDWMDRLLMPAEENKPAKRTARLHPYSTGSLHWRIYKLLSSDQLADPAFKPIRNYLGSHPSDRRYFQLAGHLAVLFDDYQVYRCKQLLEWSEIPEPDDWQVLLWQKLLADNPHSYAALFARMRNTRPARIEQSFAGAYRHIAIFGTTAMPAPYLAFLQDILAPLVPVDLFLLNPSRDYWFHCQTEEKVERQREVLMLQDHPLQDHPLMVAEQGHPLLCSLGQAIQEHLDLIDMQLDGGVSYEAFVPTQADSMLTKLQNQILENTTHAVAQHDPADDSIQIHICHNPRREVEVLHNHLLHWFTEDQLEPRQILVLAADMQTYAPLIDAVFGSTPRDDKAAIPYEIEGRPSQQETLLQNAFHDMLHITTSRFQAPQILDLLTNPSIMCAIGLDETQLGTITAFIHKAGIRWGLDAKHREESAGVAMEPFTAWDYGLERLLLGYACATEQAILIDDTDNQRLPVDAAEGASAETLGRVVRFIQQLKEFRTKLLTHQTPQQWEHTLLTLFDTFFAATNDNYREITMIREAILGIKQVTRIAGLQDDKLPLEVITSHLDNAITARPRQESLTRNAVVFGQLRPMNSRPAQVVYLLGLVDGVFPRRDNRPTFDLLKQKRFRGDRSVRQDDRGAFLEAIICARRRLIISYPGRSDTSPNTIPPSIVVQELRDHLVHSYDLKTNHAKLLPIETLHRLQSVHPAYFQNESALFSYSQDDLAAARIIAAGDAARRDPEGHTTHASIPCHAQDQTGSSEYNLNALMDFFANPAKAYYRNVLELALDIRDDRITDTIEPLTLGGLAKYAEWNNLLEELNKNNFNGSQLDRVLISNLAKANAHAPLAQAGHEQMDALIDSTLDWLQAQLPEPEGCCISVQDLLCARKQPHLHVLTTPQGHLSGCIQIFSVDGTNIQAIVRPSRIKAKDHIGGWITHLFASTLQSNIHTLVVGNKNGKPDSVYYPPIAAGEAQTYLESLIDLYNQGQCTVLAFTPESALAYAGEFCKNGKEPEAKAQARAKWQSRSQVYDRTEDQDDWMYHAFGDEGPIDSQDFAEIAIRVFMPSLRHVSGDRHSAPTAGDA